MSVGLADDPPGDARLLGPVPVLRLRPHGLPGRLVTFDGLDGSGKSTSADVLRRHLTSVGADVDVVKLPSAAVRQLAYFREFADDNRAAEDGRVDVTALFTVLLGDRLLTVRQRILPMLARGGWVLCDRYVFMTFAQMAAFGSTPDDLEALRTVAELFPRPDLACITDVAAETAERRIRERDGERATKIDLDIFARVVLGLREVGRRNDVRLLPTRDAEETRRILVREATALMGREATET